MGLLQRIFGLGGQRADEAASPPQVVARADVDVDGTMVDGVATCELARSHKDDLATMLRCCTAEITSSEKTDLVPAPFYFNRAAILYRCASRYDLEQEILGRYITCTRAVQARARPGSIADPIANLLEMERRIAKSRALQERSGRAGA